MAIRRLKGSNEKLIFRNERFTKGTVSTNDPQYEGSFRRLINFKVSNQNSSLENREPFLTIPLYNYDNEEVKLSEDSFVFSFNEDTEHSYILDFNQKLNKEQYFFERTIAIVKNNDYRIIDGDTIIHNNVRYRLAIIDAPELDDTSFDLSDEYTREDIKTLGQQAKEKLTEILYDKNFRISHISFQTELVDEFGRPLVFIILDDNTIVNFKMIEEGYASIYNIHKFENNNIKLYVPREVFLYGIGSPFYQFSSELDRSIKEKESFSPMSRKYFVDSKKIDIINTENNIYTKPMVYKIKKETELYNQQFNNELGMYSHSKLIRRVVKTIPVNEVKTKLDLELFSDQSLKYIPRSEEFVVTYSKYENQYLNFFVDVLDIYGNNIYTGLIELSRTSPNYEEGIFETFHLRTYKKPEMHVELQDITNFKPNLLDANSIIPKRIYHEAANVLGYKTPKVDIVLMSMFVDNWLNPIKKTSIEDGYEKYPNTNVITYQDFIENKSIIKPIFKRPVLYTDKNKYMYRWDIISAKQLENPTEKELEETQILFRSAWTDLDSGENLSQNKDRLFTKATDIKNASYAEEFYTIEIDGITTSQKEDYLSGDVNLEDMQFQYNSQTRSIEFLQNLLNDELSSNNLSDLKNDIKNLFNNPDFKIRKVPDITPLMSNFSKEKDEFLEFHFTHSNRKNLTEEQIEELFEKIEEGKKKVTFVLAPVSFKFRDEDDISKEFFLGNEVKTFFFDNEEGREKLPVDLTYEDLSELESIKDFNDFFQEGFTAVFYLNTYESVEKLDNDDEFYDNTAYRKSSATYLFKENRSNLTYKDFIDDKLDKESYAIQYSKYISKFRDHTIVYGNPMYKNSLFMSEPGSPYYFGLVNTFEFDHEIVHVNQFKDTLIVFTINDIWVIYEIEEKESIPYKDEEGNTQYQEITTYSFRSKKILYNISTEFQNKKSIHNLTKYITLISNDILYLIKPSAYIADDTQFNLSILSSNIESILKDPLLFINERLVYFGFKELATTYEFNMNATDNFIKLYYSVNVEDKPYTLIITYDVINNRWYEEDTASFGYPKQIYLLDSTTGYEMLTKQNDQLFITYQTDKFKNMIVNEFGESHFDIAPIRYYNRESPEQDEQRIEYYIDTGYIKLSEHLRKRFRTLMLNMKNIDSKEIYFTYNFSVDDIQFENNFIPTYTTNSDGKIIEVEKMNIEDFQVADIKEFEFKMKHRQIFNVGYFDNYFLDFSNLTSSDIMMLRHNLLGRGRIPRIRMGFSAKNRFYILSYGIVYLEKGGN